MRSTFAGLDTARKALAAQQYALETTLHNVANANTEGYSRQRVEMSPTTPTYIPGINGYIGNGVQIDSVIRVRDEFIDYQLRNEYTTNGFREYSATILSRVESFFNEPGEGGLKVALNNFFNSLQNLTRDVTDSSLRAEVRSSGDVLASVLNSFDYQLQSLIKDIDASVIASVNSINTIADQIAKLNFDIFNAESNSGFVANDLRDRRDTLIDKLSKICEVQTVNEGPRLSITVNGLRLVSHDRATKLEAIADPTTGLHDLQWNFGPNSVLPAEITGGQLGAQIAMRHDVQHVYRAQMDQWTREFVMTVNAQHRKGYYLDEDDNWEQGMDFFIPSGFDDDEGAAQPGGYSIHINPLIMEEGVGLSRIAAVGIDEEGNGPYVGNNANALLLAQLRSNKGLLAELQEEINSEIEGGLLEEEYGLINLTNTFEEKFATILLELGIRADSNNRIFETSTYQTQLLEQRRSATSDVSLDEEMTAMIRYQQAYSAAARLSSAINDILTTLMDRVFV